MSITFEPGPDPSPEPSPEPVKEDKENKDDILKKEDATIEDLIHSLPTHSRSYSTVRPHEVQRFLDLLEVIKSKKNGEFCKKQKGYVEKWGPDEVAYWIKEIGFEKYSYPIYCAGVDGEMLLKDMTADALKEDLSASQLHASAIVRYIQELKEYINNPLNDPNYIPLVESHNVNEIALEHDNTITNLNADEKNKMVNKLKENELKEQEYILKINELENNKKSSEETINKQQEEMKTLQNDIQKLQNEIATKQQQIVQKDYTTMDLQALEGELISLKEEIKKINQIVENRKPKSEDILQMEILIREEFEDNIDGIPEASQATSWKIAHVGAWMRNIVRFPQYIGTIFTKKIDGDIILRDWNTKEAICEILEIHDNELHLKHIFREVTKLKEACGLNDNHNDNNNENNVETMKQKIDELSVQLETVNNDMMNTELKNEDLNKEKLKLEENQTILHNQIKKFTDENIGLNNQCDALKMEISKLIDKEKEGSEYKALLEHERKNKIHSIRELSLELDTLRKASKIMNKQINVYKEFIQNAGFHPLDNFLEYLGYEKQQSSQESNGKKNKTKHYY